MRDSSICGRYTVQPAPIGVLAVPKPIASRNGAFAPARYSSTANEFVPLTGTRCARSTGSVAAPHGVPTRSTAATGAAPVQVVLDVTSATLPSLRIAPTRRALLAGRLPGTCVQLEPSHAHTSLSWTLAL